MSRSAVMMAWMIAFFWIWTAAEAQSRGMVSFNGGVFHGSSFNFGGSANALFAQRRSSGQKNLFFGSGTYPFYPNDTREAEGSALPARQTHAVGPPCRETSAGVVVLRGRGCASTKP